MVYTSPDWQENERAVRGLREWFEQFRASETRSHLLAAAILSVLAVGATLLTWLGLTWCVMAIIGRLGSRTVSRAYGLDGYVLAMFGLSAAILLMVFLFSAWRWRARMSRISLHGGELALDHDGYSPSILVPTEDSEVADALDWLLFPATLTGMMIGHLLATRHLKRADPDIVARCLTLLARAGRRVLLHDLERQVADARLPDALRAMRHIKGVLWWTRDQVALSLNDELAALVAQHGAWRGR